MVLTHDFPLEIYVTQWLLPAFTITFPVLTAVRLWDWCACKLAFKIIATQCPAPPAGTSSCLLSRRLFLDGTDAAIAASLSFIRLHKTELFATDNMEAIQKTLLTEGRRTTLPARLVEEAAAIYEKVGGPRRLAAMREEFTVLVTASNESTTRQQAENKVTQWWAEPDPEPKAVLGMGRGRTGDIAPIDGAEAAGGGGGGGLRRVGSSGDGLSGRLGKSCSAQDLALLADAYASHSLLQPGSPPQHTAPGRPGGSPPPARQSAAALVGLDPFEERTLDFPGSASLQARRSNNVDALR